MKRIDIKLNYECNNRCLFCVQGNRRYLHQDKMSTEIKKHLQDSRGEFQEVVFTGGEVTIRPDVIELVKYAKKMHYKVQVQSNGRMFAYKDFCIKMIDAGVETFAISIHAHNAKLHDRLTGVKGSFQQTTQGIRNLLSLSQLVVTNTVINKMNYRFLPRIANCLIRLGVLQYQFAFPHILGNALKNRSLMIPKKTDVMPYVRQGLKIGFKNKIFPRVEAIPVCFLKGFERCLTDSDIPDSKVFDVSVTESFQKWRKEEGKLKGPRCKKCKFYTSCEGPWREYPEIYGWEEFIPVKR